MCRPCHTWCPRQRLPRYCQAHCNHVLNQRTDPSSEEKWQHSFHRNGPVLPQRPRKEKTQWACGFQEEHHKPLVLLLTEEWLLHCHTCTSIFCITQSTNLGGKCWETLPSKIVSLLHNSQNEGVFHSPQRSKVTRKHKCIRLMSILPSLGPSHCCSSPTL